MRKFEVEQTAQVEHAVDFLFAADFRLGYVEDESAEVPLEELSVHLGFCEEQEHELNHGMRVVLQDVFLEDLQTILKQTVDVELLAI